MGDIETKTDESKNALLRAATGGAKDILGDDALRAPPHHGPEGVADPYAGPLP